MTPFLHGLRYLSNSFIGFRPGQLPSGTGPRAWVENDALSVLVTTRRLCMAR